MMLRVALFGTESTGKSTLASALARHFNAPWSAEYVREFWIAHGGEIRASDLGAIARGQIANEESAAARATRLLFCDTELITNTLWNDWLFPGHCPPWVRAAAERRSKRYALYLLCDADIPFTPDPMRVLSDPAERERARAQWRAALVERGLPFVTIRGAFPQRLAPAVAAIRGLLDAAGGSTQQLRGNQGHRDRCR